MFIEREKLQFGVYTLFISSGEVFPLNLWFIPKWGISIAVLVSIIAYFINAVITFVKVCGKL